MYFTMVCILVLTNAYRADFASYVRSIEIMKYTPNGDQKLLLKKTIKKKDENKSKIINIKL